MTARKTLSAQGARAAAQGGPGPEPDAQKSPQEAQERPQEAAAAPAQGSAAPQAAAPAQARPRVPGAPRDYKPETRTAAQAERDDPTRFAWTTPAPMHGITGFYRSAAYAAQDALGGEFTPEEILGEGDTALLILISHAKFLAHGEIIKNSLVVQHAEFGNFYLRCVKSPKGGFLIGVIDDYDATYGASEWYESAEDAAEAWNDWTAHINPQ